MSLTYQPHVLFGFLALSLCGYAQGFNETFDHQISTSWRVTSHGQVNYGTRSGNVREDGPQPFPTVDSTLRTEHGGYLAFSQSASSEENETLSDILMYSECKQPVSNSCKFHFDIWMTPTTAIRGEILIMHRMLFCKECNNANYHDEREIIRIGNNHTSRGWRHYSVNLEDTYSMFLISMHAHLPKFDSVIALDGLYLENCDVEPERITCPQDQFACPYSKHCIPRDFLCDLKIDCACGMDETTTECENIPMEGITTFMDCNFDSGQCNWYNVPFNDSSRQSNPPSWQIKTANNSQSAQSRLLPDFNIIGNYAYLSTPRIVKESPSLPLLRSVDLPPHSGNGQCKIRFYYWLPDRLGLQLQFVELGNNSMKPLPLWDSQTSKEMAWTRVSVPIPNCSNNYLLQLQVNVTRALRQDSAVGVRNLTLTQECFTRDRQQQTFTKDVTLSTCGAWGPKGPSQAMCTESYGDKKDVTVIQDQRLRGAQTWTIKLSGVYKIIAHGARGGSGQNDIDDKTSYGAMVTAKFSLSEGDQLIAIIGHMGESSCQVSSTTKQPAYCKNRNGTFPQSGGGGGGATVVYKMTKGQDPQLLMMAGGGGGLSYSVFPQNITPTTIEDRGYVPEALKNMSNFEGQGCHVIGGTSLAFGGFGGGFGACNQSGGHGGGFIECFPNVTDSVPGLPGSVYVSPQSLYFHSELKKHGSHGQLEMYFQENICPCNNLCMWREFQLSGQVGLSALLSGAVKCIPEQHPESVIQQNSTEKYYKEIPVSFFIIFAAVLIILFTIGGFVIYVMRYGSVDERTLAIRNLVMQCLHVHTQSIPLQPLSSTVLPVRLTTVNPNYSFSAFKAMEEKLPEIPRDNLRLSVQLGQGAFGVVYRGYLSSGSEREIDVAVKTLPSSCSEQTEIDFFMEVYIVSKFNHPNIVQFLGVCFDQHPRYLVLELLAGGNLKAFLRESRPAKNKVSVLTVGELLSLSIDIARGCNYLEKNHFIHRDIAARNCLLTTKGPDRVAKIADFGMSRDIYRADYYKKEGRALLPLKWMPPEAFMDGIFTSKTDVWSFGIVLWEIFTMGCMPYPGLSNNEVMNFVFIGGRLDPPNGCLPSVYDLMLSCWAHKCEDRPSFEFLSQCLENIFQDKVTMSQGVPEFQMVPCRGRPLKLLNPPVRSLSHDLAPDDVTSLDFVGDSSSLQPLLQQ